MKKIKLTLIISLMIAAAGPAFGQTLYGLKKTENGSSTIPFDVVSIDPMTGATEIVLSTNSLIGVAAGASTYDQLNSRYICWGFDTQNNQQLYVMDLDDLQSTSSPFSATQAIEMEYDLQTQKAYGLWWDGSAEHFGEIDLNTGLVTSIAVLPGVDAVAIGNSTFDSNTGTYIFIGLDNNQYKLYSVDAATGTIINAPSIWQNGERYSALEFNNQNGGKLYGLYQDVDYDNYSQTYQNYYTDLRLAEIDLNTGTSTLVDPENSVIGGYVPGYALGGLCFDQQTQTYIVRLQNETGGYLTSVDVNTANVIAATPLSNENYFYELQVDNLSFAQAFYNLSNANDLTENPAGEFIEGTIYPVPAKAYLTIQTEESVDRVMIYAANGALVKEITQLSTNEIKIDDLSSGVYFLRAQTSKGEFQRQFVVR
jgi:hypothetical protein